MSKLCLVLPLKVGQINFANWQTLKLFHFPFSHKDGFGWKKVDQFSNFDDLSSTWKLIYFSPQKSITENWCISLQRMQKVSDLYKTRRVCQTGRNEPVVLFCSFSSFLRERALFLNEESLPPPTSNFELFRKTRRCKVGWPFVSKKNNARNRPNFPKT